MDLLSCFQSLKKADKKRKSQYGGSNSQSKKKKQQKRLTSTSHDASERTDPTLNELKGQVTNSDGSGSSQEGEAAIGSEGDNARTNDLLKGKRKEKSGVRGVKRRKASIVKKYMIPDETTTSNNQTTTATDQNETPNLDIVRIIKPVEVITSITNNVQDSLVTFSVQRFVVSLCTLVSCSHLSFKLFVLIFGFILLKGLMGRK